jgi:hypothetical protein
MGWAFPLRPGKEPVSKGLIRDRQGSLGYIDQFPILPDDAGRIGLYGDFARALRGPFNGFLGADQVRGCGAFFP